MGSNPGGKEDLQKSTRWQDCHGESSREKEEGKS
jgi:hypothetical protein